jgi:hypothetical protein
VGAPDTNGWTRAEMHVLEELQRLAASVETLHVRITESSQTLNSRITELKIDIGKLQVKSGVWGVIGAIAVLLPALLLKRFL